jgi:peptide/nickel transport system permease protein
MSDEPVTVNGASAPVDPDMDLPARSGRGTLRKLLGNASSVFSIVVLVTVAVVSIFAPWVAPYDPVAQDLQARNLPPFWLEGGTLEHLVGTDSLGRDLLSRIIFGARISMIVGVSTVIIQTGLGVTIGLIAGFRRGWVDTIFMRIADVWLAIPFLVLAIAIAVLFGPGLVNTVLVLGLVGWVTYARVVRGEVLSVREREYVLAARTMGVKAFPMIRRHILPNVTASILVVATLQVSRMIIAEASLSFLGLGIQPPEAAWGSMIADGRDRLSLQWWVSTMPGIALLLTTLAINLLGDSLRDILDPKLGENKGR